VSRSDGDTFIASGLVTLSRRYDRYRGSMGVPPMFAVLRNLAGTPVTIFIGKITCSAYKRSEPRSFLGFVAAGRITEVPKRVAQHIIDENAELIFRGAIPRKWVANPLRKDYAKDFLVEVFADSEPTQDVFVVQLKGQQSPRWSQRDKSFAVQIDWDHLPYYLEVVPLPVFIVGVDVDKKEAYYEFAQGELHRIG
jgi:hypothetical protein